jgi:hypothetical protein
VNLLRPVSDIFVTFLEREELNHENGVALLKGRLYLPEVDMPAGRLLFVRLAGHFEAVIGIEKYQVAALELIGHAPEVEFPITA